MPLLPLLLLPLLLLLLLLLPLLLLLLLPLLLLLLLLLLGLLLRLQTADLQAYGFSPVCWRMCLVRSPGLAAA